MAGNRRRDVLVLIVLWLNSLNCVPVNVVLNKPVSALFTCGEFNAEHNLEEESYYDHVDVNKADRDRTARSCTDATMHPPSAMVDGDVATKWQSSNDEFIRVFGNFSDPSYPATPPDLQSIIFVDLEQSFIVEKIILKLGDAKRPNFMAVYKSNNLTNGYFNWAFKVGTVDQCQNSFFVLPTNVPASLGSAVCARYIQVTATSFETIEFNFVDNVPSNLREWKRARYIKIELYQMEETHSREEHLFHHFAINELEVMAECICNGHETGCNQVVETGKYECVCGGNTVGQFCERCQSFYNQKQWVYGVPCEECNCYQHATECTYMQDLEDNQLSLNPAGVKEGGGQCLNCQDNTAGVNCEKCKTKYYRPVDKVQTDADACVLCECNLAGSSINPTSSVIADCVMNNDNPLPAGKMPGDCYCKTNVEGSKCDTCKTNFYNLNSNNADGCDACACDTAGTVGASELCTPDQVGQCTCKPNVERRTCGLCKDGFYGLTTEDPNGCKLCECDLGGASSQICDKLDGQCLCRPNIDGRKCDTPKPGYYIPDAHFIHVEFEAAPDTTMQTSQAGFFGRGYIALGMSSVTVDLIFPGGTTFSGTCAAVFRYSAPVNTMVSVQFISSADPRPMTMEFPACPNEWCYIDTSSFNLVTIMGTTTHQCRLLAMETVLLDRVICVPVELFQLDASLQLADFDANCDALMADMKVGTGFEATCMSGLFTLMSYYMNGPLSCDCSTIGSTNTTCGTTGGKCTCKPGVMGRRCDQCQAGFYQLSPDGCSACNCSATAKTCDPVTGQCTCPPNTIGLGCEYCQANTWGWDPTSGCQDCYCNSTGSTHTWCNQDTGICNCKHGVEGDKCDICMDTYKAFGDLGCSGCECNTVGSSTPVCEKDTSQCTCKDNVDGLLCDRCKAATFHLHTDNPNGCFNCVCMGVASQCSSAAIRQQQRSATLYTSESGGMTPSLSIVDTNGDAAVTADVQVVTDAATAKSSLRGTVPASSKMYWKVPDITGNMLSIYGSTVMMNVKFELIATAGTPAASEAILISNNSNLRFKHAVDALVENTETTVPIVLKESDWVLEIDSSPVPRAQFLLALANVKDFLLPATFSEADHGSFLSHLEYSLEGVAGPVGASVEQCQCTLSYMGLSCESCSLGYKRSEAATHEYLGTCVPCECNNHASTCDQDTGECTNCLHHTAGTNCEVCELGYHGDATGGTASDCSVCPCNPLGVTDMACTNDGAVRCTNCKAGYIGDLCGSCADFHYGNAVLGTCLPCDCNGRSTTCDLVTGECQNCEGNTVGQNCEKCVDGFYMDAGSNSCVDCACSAIGATSTVCDPTDGQCSCREGISGRTCDACMENYYGFSATGCTPCNCNLAGSQTGQCTESGICVCLANVDNTAQLCDACVTGYFGLPDKACEACACNDIGTTDPVGECHPQTGQCSCKSNVAGRQCDRCETLFIDFGPAGCTACDGCQTSLGTEISRFVDKWNEANVTAQTVQELETQDLELQTLRGELDQVSESLGLTNTEITTVSDLIPNITILDTTTTQQVDVLMQKTLRGELDQVSESLGLTNTEITTVSDLIPNITILDTTTTQQVDVLMQKVATLKTSATSQAGLAENEKTRLKALLDESYLILDLLNTETQKAFNHEYKVKQYRDQALVFKAQGETNGVAVGLNFDTQLNKARTDRQTIMNDGNVEDMETKTAQQAADIAGLLTREADIRAEYKTQGDALVSMDQNLSNLQNMENSISQQHDEAKTAKQQVEADVIEINNKVSEIKSLSGVADANLTTALLAHQQCDIIMSGNAASVVTDVTFPQGVTNWHSASTMLQTLQLNLGADISTTANSVTEAEREADILNVEFGQQNTTFTGVRQRGTNAVETLNAYEQVLVTLQTSGVTANEAQATLLEAQNLLSVVTVDQLISQAQTSLDLSNTQLTEVSAIDYQPQVLISALATADQNLQLATGQWTPVDVQLDNLRQQADNLDTLSGDTGVSAVLSEAQSIIGQASTKTATVNAEHTTLKTNLAAQKTTVDTLKNNADTIVTLTNSVETGANLLAARIDSHTLNKDRVNQEKVTLDAKRTLLDGKIASIETKLAQAKDLLSRLQKPVRFNGTSGVSVANPVTGLSMSYTDVEFKFKKDADVQDALLFFTEDTTTPQQFSVKLVGNQVRLDYMDNGDPSQVTSPTHLCDNCWMKVQASRYSDKGYLSVTLLDTGGIASHMTTGTPGTLKLNTNLFWASLPSAVTTTKLTTRDGFKGCMYDTKFNGANIDIWKESVQAGGTPECCRMPTPAAVSTDAGATFDGSGQLVLQANTLDMSAVPLTINIKFRTFNPNAYILLIGRDNVDKRYSIYLSGGKVVFEFGTVGGLENRLETLQQYNTGDWFQVVTEHTTAAISLNVFKVEDVAVAEEFSQSITQVDLSVLKDVEITLGSDQTMNSVTPATEYKRFSSFMKDFTYRTIGTVQRLLNQGVISGVGVKQYGYSGKVISGVMFTSEESYLVLAKPETLTTLTTIEMDIVTTASNGILIDIESLPKIIYVALFHGNIYLECASASGSARLMTYGVYISDGLLHKVKVDVSGSPVITVDGQMFSDSNISPISFNAAPMTVGGTKSVLGFGYPVRRSFVGGIANLKVNDLNIDVFAAGTVLERNKVDFSGIPDPPTTRPPLPYTFEPSPPTPSAPTCGTLPPIAPVSTGTEGWFLGNSYWKETLNTQERPYFQTSLSIIMRFAAFGSDGVLFLATNSLVNPSQWITVYMLNGIVKLNVRGSLNSGPFILAVESTIPYNDGKEIEMVFFASGTLFMMVETMTFVTNGGIQASNTVFDNINEIIVGGLDSTLTSSLLTFLPSESGFQGKIVHVEVHTQGVGTLSFNTLQQSVESAVSQNVGPAPTNVQYGVHLDGQLGSYIRLGSRSVTSGSLTVSLTLINIQPSAMLFYIYQSPFFIALDISNYKLRITLGSGSSSVYSSISTDTTNLCDYQSHTLKATLTVTSVELQVDTGTVDTFPYPPGTLPSITGGLAAVGGVHLPNQLTELNGLSQNSVNGCVFSLEMDSVSYNLPAYISQSTGATLSCPKEPEAM